MTISDLPTAKYPDAAPTPVAWQIEYVTRMLRSSAERARSVAATALDANEVGIAAGALRGTADVMMNVVADLEKFGREQR